VTVVFALLAYGPAIVDPSLSLDEQIAPPFGELGHASSWNLALYRWGLVTFDFAVLGAGNLPVLRPVLALVLLSIAAVVYVRLLPLKPEARYFFCLTLVTVPSFAYAMTFSFQSVEFVVALLLFVLGLCCFADGTSSPRVRWSRLVATLLLWIAGASFYQDYGIVLTGWLVWIFACSIAGERERLFRDGVLFGLLLCTSFALNLLIAVTIVRFLKIPPQTYFAGYFASSSLPARAMNLMRGAADLYFGKTPGHVSLAIAALLLTVLAASSPGSPAKRGGLIALAVAICIAPFVYGFGAIPPLRATSGLLFVVAGAAALAVSRCPQSLVFFAKVAVVYVALQSCATINNMFHYESLAWHADTMTAVELASRIHQVAPDVHDGGAVRVLFVGSYKRPLSCEWPGRDLWVGAFDTWGENRVVRRQRALSAAGFPAFRLATDEDYRAALPIVAPMPSWPDPRSVARFGDLVIVKLGPANGFGTL
jgi:hypothetical protein